jgi:hypothetical protein
MDVSRPARSVWFPLHWRHRAADYDQQRLRLGLAASVQVVFDANQH